MPSSVLRSALALFFAPILALAQTAEKAKPQIPASILDSNQKFALKLFRELARQSPDQNFATAPVSLPVGFGLLQNGASEEERAEIAYAFEFGSLTPTEINEGMQAIRQRWSWETYDFLKEWSTRVRQPRQEGGYRLKNALWIRHKDEYRPEFVAVNKEFYGAALHRLPSTAAAQARAVNKTAARDSESAISGLLDSSS